MLSDISIYSGSLRDRQSAPRGTPKNGRGEGGKILGMWIVGAPFELRARGKVLSPALTDRYCDKDISSKEAGISALYQAY